MQCLDSVRKTAKSLWSLVVGLRVTGDNMVKPQITVHYPRRTVESIEGYRGHVQLVGKPGNPAEPKCICCMMCVNSCPSNCITVVQAKEEAPAAEEAKAPKAAKAAAAEAPAPAAQAPAEKAVEHGGKLVPKTADGVVAPPDAPEKPAKAAGADKGDKAAKGEKKAAKKAPGVWTLDFTLCSLCGTCVAVCPVDSLEYSSNVYICSRDRKDFSNMDMLARLRAQAPAGAGKAAPAAPAQGEEA